MRSLGMTLVSTAPALPPVPRLAGIMRLPSNNTRVRFAPKPRRFTRFEPAVPVPTFEDRLLDERLLENCGMRVRDWAMFVVDISFRMSLLITATGVGAS